MSGDVAPRPTFVRVPDDSGQLVRHEGWRGPGPTRLLEEIEQHGLMYPAPHVYCGDCASPQQMEVVGIAIAGGQHSVMWRMLCEGCSATRDFPATDLVVDQ